MGRIYQYSLIVLSLSAITVPGAQERLHKQTQGMGGMCRVRLLGADKASHASAKYEVTMRARIVVSKLSLSRYS